MHEILEFLLLASFMMYLFVTMLLLTMLLTMFLDHSDHVCDHVAVIFFIIHVTLHYSLKYRYIFVFKSHMACNRILTIRLGKKKKTLARVGQAATATVGWAILKNKLFY